VLSALEQLRNRPVLPLDQPVEVDERPGGRLGDALADNRLTGADEAGEREMPS
jgi:hypothetical protein